MTLPYLPPERVAAVVSLVLIAASATALVLLRRIDAAVTLPAPGGAL